MKLAVHWQDSDSSSAKPVAECKIMICGGHAGKNYSKMKALSIHFIRKHKDRFPLISGVHCCCGNRHWRGCGCITDAFIKRACNNFYYILTNFKSAEEFAKRLRVQHRPCASRARIGRSEGRGSGAEPTREHCDFHPLKVCSCGNCADKENFECEGKDYTTWYRLTCPFHSLSHL